jgi:hypothetical protein
MPSCSARLDKPRRIQMGRKEEMAEEILGSVASRALINQEPSLVVEIVS